MVNDKISFVFAELKNCAIKHIHFPNLTSAFDFSLNILNLFCFCFSHLDDFVCFENTVELTIEDINKQDNAKWVSNTVYVNMNRSVKKMDLQQNDLDKEM